MRWRFFSLASFSLCLAAISLPRAARTELPPCAVPEAEAYFLYVAAETNAARSQTRNAFPPNFDTRDCTYDGVPKVQVSTFDNLSVAEAWAEYLKATTNLSVLVVNSLTVTASPQVTAIASNPDLNLADIRIETVEPEPPPPEAIETRPLDREIARPAEESAAIAARETDIGNLRFEESIAVSSEPVTIATGERNVLPYNPEPLDSGYVVLVDYFNRPQVAAELQRALGRKAGLVAYGQRHYLLAAHARDRAEADAILQALDDAGFWTLLADSDRAVLLVPEVRYP